MQIKSIKFIFGCVCYLLTKVYDCKKKIIETIGRMSKHVHGLFPHDGFE